MDFKIIKCKHCHTKQEVREVKLLFPEKKVIETAYCSNCSIKIFENRTDGWFTVTNLEVKKLVDEKCEYPMP
jgi:formate dehydrogenase maturation protein FdhE